MSVAFKTVTVSFPSQKGSPVSKQAKTDAFSSAVQTAEACIKSWDIQFSSRDRYFFQALTKIENVLINSDNSVQCEVSAGVRDSSGTWDDPYEATIEVLVIAELASN